MKEGDKMRKLPSKRMIVYSI